jgi:hypothetical protein
MIKNGIKFLILKTGIYTNNISDHQDIEEEIE